MYLGSACGDLGSKTYYWSNLDSDYAGLDSGGLDSDSGFDCGDFGADVVLRGAVRIDIRGLGPQRTMKCFSACVCVCMFMCVYVCVYVCVSIYIYAYMGHLSNYVH
jgi:hypothetical protein